MLRDYQQNMVDQAREMLKTLDRIIVQAPTGSGKSIVISEIIKLSTLKKNICWVVVPRLELIRQQSEHLSKWRVKHGIISAQSKESRAYDVHVVSRDTILRRLDKIKNKPRLLIMDEAHLGIDAQKNIIEAVSLDNKVKVVSFTATPERLDGRGMNEIYQGIVCGASIPYLTACGFLSPIRYFAPPLSGDEALHWKNGEVDENDLESIFNKNSVYGNCIKYYKQYGNGRRALGFCRNVKASERTAHEFRAAGYNAQSIDGSMTVKKRKILIDALKDKKIDVLISCQIATYGLDIPAVDYIFMLRPTQSRALYFQMAGRGMRVSPGKENCILIDHVNNISRFQDPRYPGVPLFSVPDLTWDFEGKKKRAKRDEREPPEVRLCPYGAFEICVKKIRCPECGKYRPREEGGEVVIESIPLQERRAAGEAHVITQAERREVQDDVLKYTEIARSAADDGSYDRAVKALCDIAERLGHSPMWVYHIVNENKYVVNVRMLESIARAKDYKPGWVHFRRLEIKERMKEKAAI
jgi:superfamily II DNA or RNA helicase